MRLEILIAVRIGHGVAMQTTSSVSALFLLLCNWRGFTHSE